MRIIQKKLKKALVCSSIVCLVSLLVSSTLSAQGCSDAGFCTIGNFKQHTNETVTKLHQSISIISSFGIGDEGVFVFSPALQYNNTINKQWSIQAKLTGNYANGNLGSAIGLGDFFIASNYTLKSKSNWQTSFTLATKLPLNLGDIKSNGKPLPMQYQSSLGTIDAIAGINVTNKQWQFAFAYQQPLTGINRNTFLPIYYNTPEANKYLPSNDFNRKADVLLRANYLFNSQKKLTVNVGLLGIYHLNEDTYIDGNISNKPLAIKWSAGLTLNATAAAWIKLNSKTKFGVLAGVPLLIRDTRPDGLTRSFVFSPELIINF